MNKSFAVRFVSAVLLASLMTACSGNGAGPPALSSANQMPAATRTQAMTSSKPDLATYYFYCSNIGLGTITAVVVANSQSDAFHVTGVSGGNGTVKPGDMLLVFAYSPADKWPSSNPGWEKNGQTSYTCPSFSGRRQIFGTVSFFVKGAPSPMPLSENRAIETAPAQATKSSKPGLATYYFYCASIGLGTITAVVVANSKDDAFHVTQVVGGNGTVMPGDMLLAIAYANEQVSHSNPGYEKNGLTTYTCPSFSGRRQVFGTATFVIANAQVP